MKIGTITFHASHNYGSMLQAYALQTYLEKEGHKVSIINYRSKAQKCVYSHPLSVNILKRPRFLLGTIYHVRRTICLIIKWNKFESFLKKRLHVTKEYNTIEELNGEKFHFDVVITGSDQIWNTRPIDFSPVYFLPFVKDVKKIAFSPSLGPSPDLSEISRYCEYLSSFSALSVREKNAVPIIQHFAPECEVKHCIDPTLLINAEDYIKMMDSKRLIKEKYILFYAPADQGNYRDYLELANALGKETNCKVITTEWVKKQPQLTNFANYLTVGPLEFLSLIRDAEFVCGRSFHLVVFAILFHKEFYTINAATDARIQSLLNDLGIENRNISSVNINEFKRSIVHYENLATKLQSIREKSYSFLKQSLSE